MKIRDKAEGLYDNQKFLVINEKSKSIIYTHLTSTEAYVCFVNDRDMFFKISVKANITIPKGLIEADEMNDFHKVIS